MEMIVARGLVYVYGQDRPAVVAEETSPLLVGEGTRQPQQRGKRPVIALRDLDLVIYDGEFVAVIGPNGSGKSTLAKHLNALLFPSRGVVLVGGMDTTDPRLLWDIRRTAGMVFQNPDNQIVATVVEEDVAFGPENLGVPPRELRKRVDWALEAVRLKGYERHAPHQLSGGQKQRVAIAGVLAMKPKCIVLDEPTAMLDPLGRQEVLATVKRLNEEEGLTIVLITHYMEEAVSADRVVVMNEGKIEFQGPPAQVFSRVEDLKRIGLDVPQVAELAHRLRARGIDVPTGILTVDQLVDWLWEYWSRN